MSLPGLGALLPRGTDLVAAALPEPGTGGNAEAAREFEGLLMAQLFQSMRKTVEPSGLFGGDDGARSTYDYLLDQAVVASAMKAGQGWGLAKRLEESWASRQNGAFLS